MSIINVDGFLFLENRGPMISGRAREELAGLTEQEVYEKFPSVCGIERFRAYSFEIRLNEPIGLLLKMKP